MSNLNIEHSAMVENIVALFRLATEEEHTSGIDWYANALDIAKSIAKLHGTTVNKVAGIIAALSPQLNWETNVRYASQIVPQLVAKEPLIRSNGKNYHTSLNVGKCVAIFNSDGSKGSIVEILSPRRNRKEKRATNGAGILNKTASFFLNIRYNADSGQRVTIDAHAAGAAIGAYGDSKVDYDKRGIIASQRYHEISAAYAEAADQLGIAPYQLQAVVWLAYRRLLQG